ncbi:hypothetical protein E2C01_050097 [Portunus trituberculatus]|uniref:Uncharacterized protein n=1 Tax=Portunus trituberculatus TaxID=210409 RepID=A0A5B7GHZ8_PORTR|nr:hypothetical protein [Portunus trituberculatus]
MFCLVQCCARRRQHARPHSFPSLLPRCCCAESGFGMKLLSNTHGSHTLCPSPSPAPITGVPQGVTWLSPELLKELPLPSTSQAAA